VRLAASLGERVLFACLEMGQHAATLHAVARRTQTDAADLWISDAATLGELCAEVGRAPAPRAVVVDSLSSLARGAEDAALAALRRAMPRPCALVATVHVTKTGAMAGPEDLAHLCDTIAKLTADAVTTEGEKNRFGVLASGARPPRL
jgi:predicted ATP-dependent serine protease